VDGERREPDISGNPTPPQALTEVQFYAPGAPIYDTPKIELPGVKLATRIRGSLISELFPRSSQMHLARYW